MNLYHYILGFFLKFLLSGNDDGICNFLTVGTCTYEDEFLIQSYENIPDSIFLMEVVVATTDLLILTVTLLLILRTKVLNKVSTLMITHALHLLKKTVSTTEQIQDSVL